MNLSHEVRWQQHCQNPPVNRTLIAFLAFLILIQIRADQPPSVGNGGWEGYRGLRNLGRLRAYLRDRAWQPPAEQRLFMAAAQAMAEAAQDPYTHLLTPEMARWAQDMLEDRLRGGIGVEVAPCRGRGLRIVRVAPHSPAAMGNLQANDIILEVDGEPLAGLSFAAMVSRLRGEAGTTVRLKIERPDGAREVIIARQPLAPTIHVGRRLIQGGIGYLLLSHFAEGVASAVQQEIRRLRSIGMRALVLDLRWNPGGSLEEALLMADMFLPRGSLIVQEEYRVSGKLTRRQRQAKKEPEFAFPLAVLVEKESASAAELMAAALQEHKRAVLVGGRTFGKARIQEILPLEGNAGALRLTVGRYLTPSGCDLEGEGLQPDIAVALPAGQYWEIGRRWVEYVQGRGEPPLANDNQASRAIAELESRCSRDTQVP